MRKRLEKFFKQHTELAIVIFFLAILVLVFLMPKIYFFFTESGKRTYWIAFILSFGISMLTFFFQKSKKTDHSEAKPIERSSAPRSYQKLLDEVQRCSKELRKHLMWAYSYLIIGCIAILLGRWSEIPPYNHPIFAIPVFTLAFLGATRSLEEENELDTTIVNCVIEGIAMERKRPELESTYFHDLGKSYEGTGLWQMTFIRVSPFLMIIFSLFNTGLLTFFVNNFSIPEWIANCGSVAFFGLAYFFLARMICRPYFWLLARMKKAWELNF